MKKKIILLATATVLAMLIVACGGSSDKKETTKIEQADTNSDNSTEESEENVTDKADEGEYVIYSDGEEVKTSRFFFPPMNYYGPSFGYTEIIGGQRFSLTNSQSLFWLDSCEDIRDIPLEQQMDKWLYEYNMNIGMDLNVQKMDFTDDLSATWYWVKQEFNEKITINGRECMKIGGIVAADTDYGVRATYVYGYYFNIKYTDLLEDIPTYTEAKSIIGGIYNSDNDDKVNVTDEQKKELQHNVDTIMNSTTYDTDDGIFKYE